MAQDTGIKEHAYALSRKYGWDLEYNGGLELDGEYLDDADLSRTYTVAGVPRHFVLNISFADTTAYGFMLMEESAEPVTKASVFGTEIFTPAPAAEKTLAEKYYFTSPEKMREVAEEALTALLKKVS